MGQATYKGLSCIYVTFYHLKGAVLAHFTERRKWSTKELKCIFQEELSLKAELV